MWPGRERRSGRIEEGFLGELRRELHMLDERPRQLERELERLGLEADSVLAALRGGPRAGDIEAAELLLVQTSALRTEAAQLDAKLQLVHGALRSSRQPAIERPADLEAAQRQRAP